MDSHSEQNKIPRINFSRNLENRFSAEKKEKRIMSQNSIKSVLRSCTNQNSDFKVNKTEEDARLIHSDTESVSAVSSKMDNQSEQRSADVVGKTPMIALIMQLLITVGPEHIHLQVWKKREQMDWPSDEEKTLPELDALYRVEGFGCNVQVWNTTKNQGTKTFANESVEKVFSRDFGIIRNNAEEIEILKIVLNTTHHLADKFVRNFRHIMYAMKVECIFLILPNDANLVYMLLESVSPLELNRIIIHNRSDRILKLEPRIFLLRSWRSADTLEMRKVDFQKPENLAGFKNLIFIQKTVNGEKIVSLMNNVGKFDAIENISIKAKPILGPIISKILDYPHGFENASKVWYIKSKNVGEFKVAVAPHHMEITKVLRSPNNHLLM